MEDRKPRGVMVLFCDCKDPSKEAEFNKWYNETHIPDVLSTGAFHTATRWENTNPQPGEQKFLVIYETDMDPVEAAAKMRPHVKEWRDKGRMSPLLTNAKSILFSRITKEESRRVGIRPPVPRPESRTSP